MMGKIYINTMFRAKAPIFANCNYLAYLLTCPSRGIILVEKMINLSSFTFPTAEGGRKGKRGGICLFITTTNM